MTSDLERGKWSVLSERGCEKSGLTHDEARGLVHRLRAEGRHGLCIISDDAASRIESQPKQWSEPGAIATGSTVDSRS